MRDGTAPSGHASERDAEGARGTAHEEQRRRVVRCLEIRKRFVARLEGVDAAEVVGDWTRAVQAATSLQRAGHSALEHHEASAGRCWVSTTCHPRQPCSGSCHDVALTPAPDPRPAAARWSAGTGGSIGSSRGNGSSAGRTSISRSGLPMSAIESITPDGAPASMSRRPKPRRRIAREWSFGEVCAPRTRCRSSRCRSRSIGTTAS